MPPIYFVTLVADAEEKDICLAEYLGDLSEIGCWLHSEDRRHRSTKKQSQCGIVYCSQQYCSQLAFFGDSLLFAVVIGSCMYCVIALCVLLLQHAYFVYYCPIYCWLEVSIRKVLRPAISAWFPCVYKRMLRWFPILQVATACFSCSPPGFKIPSSPIQ